MVIVGAKKLIALVTELRDLVEYHLNRYEMEVPTPTEARERKGKVKNLKANIAAEVESLITIDTPKEEKELLLNVVALVRDVSAHCQQNDLIACNAALRKLNE